MKLKSSLIRIKCNVRLYTEGVLKWFLKKAKIELGLLYEGVTDHETDEGPSRCRASFALMIGCFRAGWSDSTIYEIRGGMWNASEVEPSRLGRMGGQ